MNKTGLIIGREYFTRVKKKSFLIMTILVPVIMIGFYAGILLIAVKGGTGSQKIAVIDEAGLISDSLLAANNSDIKYSLIKNETEQGYVPKYKAAGYDGMLYIPAMSVDSPRGFMLHSPSTIAFTSINKMEKMLNDAVENRRLTKMGIDPATYKNISANINIESTIDSKDGAKKSSAAIAYGMSLFCGFLIYLMMIIYGTQVMRGVTEEKTSRIAEVVVSSVKPFQLMMGKIIGIGAVGLTQFSIWIIMIILANAAIPLIFPDAVQQATAAAGSMGGSASMAATITEGLAALPLLKIGLLFMFYFLGGYLTYAALFAAVGSVVSEDQQEAQQLIFPILMPIIVGFVIMMQAINTPHSTIAVVGSIFPLTSPVVMMGRITYDIPFWQLGLSMLLLILCFLFFTWITAKIYRTGILMYGKKPSWKEMMKWAFRKG